ncbi:FAD-dependent oxidoreductase [Microbacterium sp. X-17]|uniref:FAD-dependent oxidoreductase n=1 Tax=Microbacterium sp. X-17 TaxID=3144404 RepID=UPI0031F56FB6
MPSLWKHAAVPVAGTPFEPGRGHDVIVVGAGITGLATAYELQRTGFDVAVVEAGEVAELATGGNTGKVSLLQGTALSRLRRHHPAALVRAYVEANTDGAEWVARRAEELGVPYVRRPAYTYAQRPDAVGAVQAEHDAAREAGLATWLASPTELAGFGFPAAAAVVLDNALAIDPVRFASALARSFLAAGGRLHLRTPVRRVGVLPRAWVETDAGPLFAHRLVLATATPITDRGLYFAKVEALRSACVSFRLEGPVSEGMFLSADAPTRSLRPVADGDGPVDVAQLVVGGAGHRVGRAGSERALFDELVDWARRTLPVGEETHRWSAQDYAPHGLIPFVGAMPRSLGRIRFATGYAKWGLSNGPAAALRIVSELRGVPRRERPSWITVIGTRVTIPADLSRGTEANLAVARAAVGGWADAERRPVPVSRPPEGSGVVARRGLRPVGISTTDGVTRGVEAVCSHLGGVLEWNDLECTWDCPLHGSRFGPDGVRREGPARRDLRPMGRVGIAGEPRTPSR